MTELFDLGLGGDLTPPKAFPVYGRTSFGDLSECPSCGFKIPFNAKGDFETLDLFGEAKEVPTDCPACREEYDAGANLRRIH
ncbi:hypothetical protein [Roseibium aggregatum]|uniref:Uncharacterized protein n=1 Tax=Roseibium aggregatum TaxID=187304 RepID=A0A0M6Y9L6_9HYPH|nr:hypothetical protein [Roseibium aggregatum]CTQ45691.1 hypothetical protein LAL4801_04146 [Roseibium aggregatum]